MKERRDQAIRGAPDQEYSAAGDSAANARDREVARRMERNEHAADDRRDTEQRQRQYIDRQRKGRQVKRARVESAPEEEQVNEWLREEMREHRDERKQGHQYAKALAHQVGGRLGIAFARCLQNLRPYRRGERTDQNHLWHLRECRAVLIGGDDALAERSEGIPLEHDVELACTKRQQQGSAEPQKCRVRARLGPPVEMQAQIRGGAPENEDRECVTE